MFDLPANPYDTAADDSPDGPSQPVDATDFAAIALAPNGKVWATVGLLSLSIRRTDEGVVVTAHPLDHEDDPNRELASFQVFEEDAREAISAADEAVGDDERQASEREEFTAALRAGAW